MRRKVKAFFLAVIVVVLFLIGGCTRNATSEAGAIQNATSEFSEKGTLAGTVTIGPLCPVEREPPDPGCRPTDATYKAWPIALFTPDKKAEIIKIVPSLNGTFSIELPVGDYVVGLEKSQASGIGRNNLPVNITIKVGENLTLNINIDTGIR